MFHVVDAFRSYQNSSVLNFIFEPGKFTDIFQDFHKRNFFEFKIGDLSGTDCDIRRRNDADSDSFRIIFLAECGKPGKNGLNVRCFKENLVDHDFLELVIQC